MLIKQNKLNTNNEKVTIDDYYYYYLLQCEKQLEEVRGNLISSIESINNKLSDKGVRIKDGIIINPPNEYRIVRLKATRTKCKELLNILDKEVK